MQNKGSVHSLDFLNCKEKAIFKTAFEVDQNAIVDLAADRAPYICQSQSVNLFLRGTADKTYINEVHYNAWKKGLKSLYYCRSMVMDVKECTVCQ